jgi:Zn-dependent protease/predicted transcriptional regulator
MKRALSFPKIAGINIYIHWTFSILIIWIIYSNLRAGLTAVQVGWSVIFILSLFLCVTLHELGHALAARRYGILTKDITLYPIGGVARLEKMPEKPQQELVVALAGPAVNFLITLLLIPVLLNFTWDIDDNAKVLIIGPTNFLPMLGILNVWLALFNLIPAFPMDGGRVLRALLAMRMDRVKATQIAAGIGKLLAFGFVVTGFYLNPFLIFIGLFIILGANAEEQMVKTQALLVDLKAKDALMTNYLALDKLLPISHAVKLLLDGQAKSFLITENNQPYGVISSNDIVRGIKEFGEEDTLDHITQTNLTYVDTDAPLSDVFSELKKSKSPIVLVTSNGQLMGIIDAENLAELILVNDARKSAHI